MELGFFIVLAAVFMAAFVQRLAGFGYGLIAAPVAMTYFSPIEVAFLMAFWGTANSAPTAFFTRHSIPWHAFWPVVPWLMIGLIAAVIVALAASYPPARKAAHLDPCLCFQDS